MIPLSSVWRRVSPGIPVLALIAIVTLLLLAPSLFDFSGYRLDVTRRALYAAMLTATWSLLAGVAGQLSFAHVAIAGVSAYAGAIWGREITAPPILGSVWTAVAVGSIAAFLVGFGLGVVVLRLRGAYLALFTLAFSEIVRLVVIAERDVTGGRLSLRIEGFPVTDLTSFYLVVLLTVLILGAVYSILRSRIGLFLRALREDADAASAMGVHTTRLKVFVFSLTAFLVGLSASVYYHTIPRLTPEIFDLLEMGLIVIFAVLGGLESPLAGSISAFSMVILLEALRKIRIGDWTLEPGIWRFAIFGALMVITLRVAPNGLIAPIVKRISRLGHKTSFGAEPVTTIVEGAVSGSEESHSQPGSHLRHSDFEPMKLELEGVQMQFGGLVAVDGVTLVLDKPQLCGLIGPNGAGKTTLVNLITGWHRPTGGGIILNGERVDGLPPFELARRGVGRTFQIPRAFRRMTVAENLLVPGLASHARRSVDAATADVHRVLRSVGLSGLADAPALELSGGQQKLLEIGRLLMLDARIMLLDEPFAGVHAVLKASIAELIARLRDEGRIIVLIEHDLTSLFSLCDRLVVLDAGRIVADGEPDIVRNDPNVISAYLGSAPPNRQSAHGSTED